MLLAVIMFSTAMIAAFPAITASAANSAASTEFEIQPNMYIRNGDEETFTNPRNFKNYFNNISSASELLEKELSAGQLMYTTSDDGMYTIYVNVYTGYMYYKNNLTGQILTSNYYNYSATSTASEELFSQIYIEYYNITESSNFKVLHSFKDAAARGQIYVSKLTNGLRVNYTLGDTALRYLVPGRISDDRYMNNILLPILEKYLAAVRDEMKTTSLDEAKTWTQFQNKYYGTESASTTTGAAKRFFQNYLHYYQIGTANSKYTKDMKSLFNLASIVMDKDITGPKESCELVKSGAINDFNSVLVSVAQLFDLNNEVEFCKSHKCGGKNGVCSKCEAELYKGTIGEYLFYDANGRLDVTAIGSYIEFIYETLVDMFGNSNPLHDELYYPLYAYLVKSYKNGTDGNYVYCNLTPGVDDVNYALVEELIKEHCVLIDEPTYSYNDMYRDEKQWGYVHNFVAKPVFRCALEYTFNSDGTLCVTLPANSIAFDESSYILGTITPLKYFGSGNINTVDYNGERSGYIFYPDGSGAVINYKDFKLNVANHAQIYGIDHAYSDITKIVGDYREQITMPVYGMVYTEAADEKNAALTGTTTLNNGFFAVIEEGASLATLWSEIKINQKLAVAYATYQPYSSDTYDLSQTIKVGELGEYKMTAESKYNGSYKTRISMLSDSKLTDVYGKTNYNASYVGMAECYREYLKASGKIGALADIGNDLPLYIEAFGSMEVMEKFLSFPIEVAVELTTFSDIRTMYDQFADAKAVLHQKAVEYQRRADAEEKDIALKTLYEEKAADYLALENKITNITNINFRLTGFANGGMEYTYPSRVKWDKVVGGKEGFERLLSYAGDVATRGNGAHLGIYPEFDFLYISNTSSSDGISVNKISAKLIDNRYANKQIYNSVTHLYESLFTRVVSADALAELYVSFNKDFSDFDIKSISVSTLGSDVNSNFDDENPINRDEAAGYVSDLLSSMRTNGYDIMVNKGNAYSIEYASHVIDAYIDSSHLTDASYTVPFFGMVLHGYVNYTGGALNYSGDPSYDILRSIESGASLYYILCYQNTENMKDDIGLNQYYGVNYTNWFDKVVEQYNMINSAIGSLQTYEIVNHQLLKVERVIDDAEKEKAYSNLINELVENTRAQIQLLVNAAFDDMKANGEYGRGVKVEIDINAILSKASEVLHFENNTQLSNEYIRQLKSVIVAYLEALEDEFNEDKYPTESDNPYKVVYNNLESYTSKYNYVTDSYSTDGVDYVSTDYTVDNYNVVLVTYRNASTGKEVKFVLNYNIYDIIVNIEDEEPFQLSKYGFKILE